MSLCFSPPGGDLVGHGQEDHNNDISSDNWGLGCSDSENGDIEMRRPGKDVGILKPRCEEASFPVHVTEHVWDSIETELVEMLYKKTSQCRTEASITTDLKLRIKTLNEEAPKSEVSAMKAVAFPSYKGMLCMLTHYGTCKWDEEVYYDMCPCGFIYRTDHRDAQICPLCNTSRCAGLSVCVCVCMCAWCVCLCLCAWGA